MSEKPIGVAVLGLGNVGTEVVRIIEDSADDLAARIGAPLELRGVGVRRVSDDRGVPADLLTDDRNTLGLQKSYTTADFTEFQATFQKTGSRTNS